MALQTKTGVVRKILKTLLFFFLFAIVIALIVIYDANTDWFIAHLFYRYLFAVSMIILATTIITIFVRSEIITKALNTSFMKSANNDIAKYHKTNNQNLVIVNSINVNKNTYANEKTMYLQANWIIGLFVCIPTAFYLTLFIIKIGINIYAVIISIFLLLILNYFFGRIIIVSSKGILTKSLFKNQLLHWSEIETIDLSTFYIKANSDLLIIINGRKRIKSNSRMVVSIKIKSYFWPKMIHHIMAYWDEEIVNLQNVKHWRCYLDKNGTAID